MKQQVVVVLGMHRSGTSAITAGLQTLGVDIGTQSEHLPPPEVTSKDTNRKGFFELEEIVYWHEVLLSIIGRRWSDWAELADDISLSPLAGFIQSSVHEYLRKRFGEVQTWGFKDPRTCIMLPIWRRIFSRMDVVPKAILVVRNPISVAQSLHNRDGMDHSEALQLWMRYTADAVLGSSKWPQLVVDYDQWILNPFQQIMRVAGYLGYKDVQDSAVRLYAQEFIDPHMRHHVYPADERSGMPEYVLDVYHAMRDASLDMQQDNFLVGRVQNAIGRWKLDEGWHNAGLHAIKNSQPYLPIGEIRWGLLSDSTTHLVSTPWLSRKNNFGWLFHQSLNIIGPAYLDIVMPSGKGWVERLTLSAIDIDSGEHVDILESPIEVSGMVPFLGQGRWAKMASSASIRISPLKGRLNVTVEAIWRFASEEDLTLEVAREVVAKHV